MSSARFGLPFLVPGQASKEVIHNEALQQIEALVQPVVAAEPSNDPPPSTEAGAQYLVDLNPRGAWGGHPTCVATWSDGGWRFTPTIKGMTAVHQDTGMVWRLAASGWEEGILHGREVRIGDQRVLGPRQPAISEPEGGSMADLEARATLGRILQCLRQHGLVEAKAVE